MYTLEIFNNLTIESVKIGSIKIESDMFSRDGFITHYKNSNLVTLLEGGSASGIPVTTIYLCEYTGERKIKLLHKFEY